MHHFSLFKKTKKNQKRQLPSKTAGNVHVKQQFFGTIFD